MTKASAGEEVTAQSVKLGYGVGLVLRSDIRCEEVGFPVPSVAALTDDGEVILYCLHCAMERLNEAEERVVLP